MNCLRLSFFEPDIDLSRILEDVKTLEALGEKYMGFIVVRPILPGSVGRTVINVNALRYGNSIQICKVNIRSSAYGVKLYAEGFPHSSQDSQFLTCAETSIWSIMEYYGNKYPEYTPVMPKQIHEILQTIRYQRNIPSSGLRFEDISSVLKSFGFGCTTYGVTQMLRPDGSKYITSESSSNIYRLMSVYIESGIPFVVALQAPGFGHAVVCVGEEKSRRSGIHSILPGSLLPINKTCVWRKYYHWADVRRKLVFNDDNTPPYAVVNYDDPCPQHTPRLGCPASVVNLIVPLYRRIYMDAERALRISELHCNNVLDVPENMVLRTLLVSSNSYLDSIVRDNKLHTNWKRFIMEVLKLPKFVWITEISSKDNFERDTVEGIVMLDATEPLEHSCSDHVIFSVYGQMVNYFDSNLQKTMQNKVSLSFERETYRNLL